MTMTKRDAFYKSDKWRIFRQIRIDENLQQNGGVLTCEYCHKPISDQSKCHIHHKIELTDENVIDPTISLSSDNTMVLHHECHNAIHHRYTGTLSQKLRKVFLVYGPPCAGKDAYVRDHAEKGDIILSMDRLSQAVGQCDPVLFKMRAVLFDCIKRRVGNWQTAWIVESAPSRAKREELCRVYGAEHVYIEATEAECLQRRKDEKRPEKLDEYIREWFERYRE